MRRSIINILLLCFCLSTFSSSADIIEDFAKNPDIINAKLSPNGDYIGILREVEGKRSVVIFKFPSMQFSSFLQYPDRNEIGTFWWVNNDRIVADVRTDYAQYEDSRSTGELFAMNADGTKRIHLYGYRAGKGITLTRTNKGNRERASASMTDPLIDEEKYALITIYRWSRGNRNPVESAWINVYTGQQSKQVRAPAVNADIIADPTGTVRFAFHIDDDQNAVNYIRDVETNSWEVFNKTPYGDAMTTPIALNSEGKIFVKHSPNGGPYGIYMMDPAKGALEEIYQHDRVDSSVWLDRFDTPFGVVTEDGKPEFTALLTEHPLSQIIAQLSEVFPAGFVDPTSATRDYSLVTFSVVQDTKTPEIFLFDAERNEITSLFDSRPWFNDTTLAPMEPIEITARDGLELQGYLTLPVGSSGKNLPLVIVPHGGPHGPRDTWGYQYFEGFIPASGYAMLQINYRGSGGYGPDFENAGHLQWAGKMQDDLTDSVQWAIQQGIADPERICIFGWSYGGYAAVMSAAKEPDLYKCAVAGAGVYDQEVQYKKSDFAQNTRWGKKYIDKVIGPTKADRVAASPITYVDQIKTPILLIHGEQDARVPIKHSKDLQKAFKATGKPKPRLIKLRAEEHSPRTEKNKALYMSETIKFFDKYIGT
mgnify:CR=1 FL=1